MNNVNPRTLCPQCGTKQTVLIEEVAAGWNRATNAEARLADHITRIETLANTVQGWHQPITKDRIGIWLRGLLDPGHEEKP